MGIKNFSAAVLFAALGSGSVALGGADVCVHTQSHTLRCKPSRVQLSSSSSFSTALTGKRGSSSSHAVAMPNLVDAARLSTPAVVHIKSTYQAESAGSRKPHTPLEEFFRDFLDQGSTDSSKGKLDTTSYTMGSGVIISGDGYIVTNNHVIDRASTVEVTLNDNSRHVAKIIGQDPDTDLALLKIGVKKLPCLKFGNSDALQVGEWVLAVGNPFDLESTVTKGIVSAKARNIHLLKNSSGMTIESFIQTDAAVNSGNSGGALVNLKGELVGINTAISAPGGTFAGYAFAIPSTIVKKVTNDLKKYGAVQRAVLGVVVQDLNADLAKEKGLKQFKGVYVPKVYPQSAAKQAGLKGGDVLVAINGKRVNSTSEFQEHLMHYKPNDRLRITFFRKNKEHTVTVVLRQPEITSEFAGAVVENLQQTLESRAGILRGRVHIRGLNDGPWKRAGIRLGFVLTAIDNEPIAEVNELREILRRKHKAFLVDGFYPDGEIASYAIPWGH